MSQKHYGLLLFNVGMGLLIYVSKVKSWQDVVAFLIGISMVYVAGGVSRG